MKHYRKEHHEELTKKTNDELKGICKLLGLRGYSKKKKDILIMMIMDAHITKTPAPVSKVVSGKESGSIDICFSFDTTGSMYPCLTQVRRRLTETIQRLFRDIPDLRIAIIAHGDYCDQGITYITNVLDFTNNEKKLTNFVSNVGPTGGGDFPECYELVLNEARTKLNWESGRSKVLVMIGDATPHPVGYRYASIVNNIDWRNELGLLTEAGINVYGVHAMPGIRGISKSFYEEIASTTGGFYLTLDQFSGVTDLVMGICYKQDGQEAFMSFAQEVEDSGRMTRHLGASFTTMSNGDFKSKANASIPPSDGPYYGGDCHRKKPGPRRTGEGMAHSGRGLKAVDAGRFQVIPVDDKQRVDHFIQDNGIEFERGRAFYELVRSGKKRYKVQQYKEIVLMDRATGDFFNGAETREILNLKPQIIGGRGSGEVESLAPKENDEYRVFIQSTSNTRQLVPGSSLLYEVSDWEGAAAS